MKHHLRDYSYAMDSDGKKFSPRTELGGAPLKIKILSTDHKMHSSSCATGNLEILDTKVIHEPSGKVFYTQRRFITPKEENGIKYEIIKPFSIVDIYEKNPCSGEFSTLLKQHGDRLIGNEWVIFSHMKTSKVLMRNLDWLEKNGFIKKGKEEWVNVYIDRNNVTGIGNFTYSSKKEAMAGGDEASARRYVGPVLKS